MPQKIKKIKILKTPPFFSPDLEAGKIFTLKGFIEIFNQYNIFYEENEIIETLKEHSENFKIIWDVDFTYPSGAVIYPPEKQQQYFYINIVDTRPILNNWLGDEIDHERLQQQNVFLDRNTAQKALEVQQTHLRIYKKIIEINSENDWRPNWQDADQNKCEAFFSHLYQKKDYRYAYQKEGFGFVFCNEAKDWLMSDAVSLSEFKFFLKIYN